MQSKAAEQRAVDLEPSWCKRLAYCFQSRQMTDLRNFLLVEKKRGKSIVPAGDSIFRAFNTTPFAEVKVVIVGQDPYHGPGQAHGLAFSVAQGVDIPPSLVNIFKELATDVGCPMPPHGDLQRWAEQGVLLLNSVLTVELRRPASHAGQGWEWFTDQAIALLNQERQHLVFLLWGAYAQRKGAAIDRQRHLVLETAHPSPLSAYRGFLGCGHFSQTNTYLAAHGLPAIRWCI